MKIGIVCPYSWDVPGGVQFHIRDLAEHLIRLGHEVSVLAPADDDTPLPPYVVSAGRAVPVPYNGSVARLNFGFLSAARVRRWLHDGTFDVIHIHEAGLALAGPAVLLGGAGADRSDLPHLEPPVPGDDRRVPDPAMRPWRRSARGSR